MLAGHYGVAFALKRVEPRLSLGTLFLAAQLVDLLWGFTILLEWERARIEPGWAAASPIRFISYPLTHSLLAGVLWGVAAAALYYSWPTRNTWHHARAALVVAAAVASHWLLDAVVHLPDLPLASDASARVGLGLWRSVPATLLVELAVLGGGAALYAAYMRERGRLRVGPLAGLVGVLVALQLGSTLGPPPPSMTMVALGAILMYALFPLAAAWVDRAPREPRAADAPAEGGRHRRRRRTS